MLIPGEAVPALSLPLVGGGRFDLAQETTGWGTILCFYRGLHCPICATYLKDLARLTPAFAERGLGTVAISTDGAERAAGMAEKVGAGDTLRIAHDLTLQQGRDWGLYLSTSRGKTSIGLEEPAVFTEPGLFVLRADGTLYFASIQSMPFVRPHFDDLVGAVDFAIAKTYPPRGAYTGPVEDAA